MEVLIALAIILLCAFPLINTQLLMLKAERHFTKKMEIHRLVNLVLVQVVEELYKHEIKWNEIVEGASRQFVPTGDLVGLPYQISYQIRHKTHQNSSERMLEKDGKEPGISHHMIVVTISLTNNQKTYHFDFDLYVKRKVPVGTETPLKSTVEHEDS